MTLIDQGVVESHEGDVQLADDQVLVVARVADERGAIRTAGKVLARSSMSPAELDRLGDPMGLLLRQGRMPLTLDDLLAEVAAGPLPLQKSYRASEAGQISPLTRDRCSPTSAS
ncbi:MAG: hypothetical protein ACRDRV_01645 [Pseudonocardiaceae bacterium]